jgi:hypothetical protein
MEMDIALGINLFRTILYEIVLSLWNDLSDDGLSSVIRSKIECQCGGGEG